MKHILTILIALTCATAFAQSAILQANGSSVVRGVGAVTTNVTSVLTNLNMTGESVNPDITGTNWVQISDKNSYPAWSNTVSTFYLYMFSAGNRYFIGDDLGSILRFFQYNTSDIIVTGQYDVAGSLPATGTVMVAYWYQTNYSSVSTVSVKGIATP